MPTLFSARKPFITKGCAIPTTSKQSSPVPGSRGSSKNALRVQVATELPTERVTADNVAWSPTAAAVETAFGKVDFEQVDELEVEIDGKLPVWLEGSLVLNGGGNYEPMKHMFDGFALVNKLRIGGGKAYTSHRYLQTAAYRAYKDTGKLQFREFMTGVGEEGVASFVRNVWTFTVAQLYRQIITDNASVNVLSFGDKVLAVSEPNESIYELDVESLSVRGGTLQNKMGQFQTAHPYITSDGCLVNLISDYITGYTVLKTDPKTGHTQKMAFIPHGKMASSAWVHDFPATDEYVALVENPCRFSTKAVLFEGMAEYCFMNWDPSEGSKIHLVPLDGSGEVRTYSVSTHFALHYANAFTSEDGKTFYYDVALYDDPEITNDLKLDAIRSGKNQVSKSALCRVEIPLDAEEGARQATITPLMNDPKSHGEFIEFPQINQRFRGKKHRFVYGASAKRPLSVANSVSKFDTENGTCETWSRPGCIMNEPMFIESPNPESEDDGIVISMIGEPDGKSSYLVLDAQTWTEIATIRLPYGIPARFHGKFFPK